ncbi:hypothetical protein MJO28_014629 [Puccinia striiformis f. sp. tritici]|uniref:Uncharacterized protein n=1 Tax=Puccinia striiformis f. sp. tritici TaxID=168172 RepID=A0ACC0DU07_9BASI|nr:hypothetical protein MJO28_014629 [Puccinia striiformis f. sp. tritici]
MADSKSSTQSSLRVKSTMVSNEELQPISHSAPLPAEGRSIQPTQEVATRLTPAHSLGQPLRTNLTVPIYLSYELWLANPRALRTAQGTRCNRSDVSVWTEAIGPRKEVYIEVVPHTIRWHQMRNNLIDTLESIDKSVGDEVRCNVFAQEATWTATIANNTESDIGGTGRLTGQESWVAFVLAMASPRNDGKRFEIKYSTGVPGIGSHWDDQPVVSEDLCLSVKRLLINPMQTLVRLPRRSNPGGLLDGNNLELIKTLILHYCPSLPSTISDLPVFISPTDTSLCLKLTPSVLQAWAVAIQFDSNNKVDYTHPPTKFACLWEQWPSNLSQHRLIGPQLLAPLGHVVERKITPEIEFLPAGLSFASPVPALGPTIPDLVLMSLDQFLRRACIGPEDIGTRQTIVSNQMLHWTDFRGDKGDLIRRGFNPAAAQLLQVAFENAMDHIRDSTS